VKQESNQIPHMKAGSQKNFISMTKTLPIIRRGELVKQRANVVRVPSMHQAWGMVLWVKSIMFWRKMTMQKSPGNACLKPRVMRDQECLTE
jgi:hypothetical protein